MTRAGDILGCCAKRHGSGTFMDHGAGFMPDNMHTKHFVSLATSQNFDKAFTVTLGPRPAVSTERKHTFGKSNAGLF